MEYPRVCDKKRVLENFKTVVKTCAILHVSRPAKQNIYDTLRTDICTLQDIRGCCIRQSVLQSLPKSFVFVGLFCRVQLNALFIFRNPHEMTTTIHF